MHDPQFNRRTNERENSSSFVSGGMFIVLILVMSVAASQGGLSQSVAVLLGIN